jgi:hypothetical protein
MRSKADREALCSREAVRPRTVSLYSGAGHDGFAVNRLCDVGMLFFVAAGKG